MALFSVKTLVLLRSCMLWSMAYFFVKDPTSIAKNGHVIVLAEAMDVPHTYFRPDDPMTGMIGFFLFMWGFTDLPPLFGDNYVQYLGSIVPIRALAFLCLSAAGYLTDSPLVSNSVVFSYSFLETMVNIFLYMTLREEENEMSRQNILNTREGAQAPREE
uniref:ARAD1D47146p n=1 Tax=Blastobotrys adeninivorans TaxID=409370 RepID=A0A060TJI9_BLAAD